MQYILKEIDIDILTVEEGAAQYILVHEGVSEPRIYIREGTGVNLRPSAGADTRNGFICKDFTTKGIGKLSLSVVFTVILRSKVIIKCSFEASEVTAITIGGECLSRSEAVGKNWRWCEVVSEHFYFSQ